MQSQESVHSFGWEWTQRTVFDTLRTFYRRLFSDCGIWHDHLNGKVVADVCSGSGRHVWALSKLTKAAQLISVELSEAAVSQQRKLFNNTQNIVVLQGDAAEITFAADFIYMIGAIQHVERPQTVLSNIIGNLKEGGELVVSFYMVTLTTRALKPIRAVTKQLSNEVLWQISPLLAPIVMVRKAGREMGIRNARHTAYDWFGSHAYQHYFRETEIMRLFEECGVRSTNIIRLQKGLYKIRKGSSVTVDDVVYAFGKDGVTSVDRYV